MIGTLSDGIIKNQIKSGTHIFYNFIDNLYQLFDKQLHKVNILWTSMKVYITQAFMLSILSKFPMNLILLDSM